MSLDRMGWCRKLSGVLGPDVEERIAAHDEQRAGGPEALAREIAAWLGEV